MKQKFMLNSLLKCWKLSFRVGIFMLLLLPFGSSLSAQQTTASIAMSRYFGGGGSESNFKMIKEGNFLYGCGLTTSPDFPITMGSQMAASTFSPVYAFVKMDLNGNVIYSRQVGSTGAEIAVTTSNANFLVNNGEVYFAGLTDGSDFPTVGAPSSYTGTAGYRDFVVLRLDASGNIVFSRYLGGNKGESANNLSIALENGFLYLGGSSNSTDYPVTDGSTLNKGTSGTLASGTVDDVVVTKMNASTGATVYSKYLGTEGTDGTPTDIQVENGFVALALTSANNTAGLNTFPTTDGSVSYGNAGGDGNDVIVVKLNPAGNVVYAKIFGGTNRDITAPNAILKDGTFFVPMTVKSNTMPTTDGVLKASSGLASSGLSESGYVSCFITLLMKVD